MFAGPAPQGPWLSTSDGTAGGTDHCAIAVTAGGAVQVTPTVGAGLIGAGQYVAEVKLALVPPPAV